MCSTYLSKQTKKKETKVKQNTKYLVDDTYPQRLPIGKQYDDTKKLTKWLNDRKKDEHCMKGVKFIPKEN